MERMLLQAMFDVPGREPRVNCVVVDEAAVRGESGVTLLSGDQTLDDWLSANDPEYTGLQYKPSFEPQSEQHDSEEAPREVSVG